MHKNTEVAEVPKTYHCFIQANIYFGSVNFIMRENVMSVPLFNDGKGCVDSLLQVAPAIAKAIDLQKFTFGGFSDDELIMNWGGLQLRIQLGSDHEDGTTEDEMVELISYLRCLGLKSVSGTETWATMRPPSKKEISPRSYAPTLPNE